LVALAYVQCDLGKARKDLDEVDCAIFGKKEYEKLKRQREPFPYKRGLPFTSALVLVLVTGAVILFFYLLDGS